MNPTRDCWKGAVLSASPPNALRPPSSSCRRSIPHLEAELAEATVDNALAATLLVESVNYLTSIGVPQARLLKKLRGDRDVWPTYAEIRAAKILAAPFKEHAEFELEPQRASGKHADFKVRLVGEEEAVFVEFKQSDSPTLRPVLHEWRLTCRIYCRRAGTRYSRRPRDEALRHSAGLPRSCGAAVAAAVKVFHVPAAPERGPGGRSP
jgi:hypothetical protein